MNQIPAQDHKEVVRAEWTAAAPFWKKWNQKLATQSRAATELVVKGADLSAGMRVLDLASGTGEPALSLAWEPRPDPGTVAVSTLIRLVCFRGPWWTTVAVVRTAEVVDGCDRAAPGGP